MTSTTTTTTSPASSWPKRLLERLRLFRQAVDASRVTLGQRRIYILPSRAGLAFALALLAMFIASINFNLGLGYALVFLLVGLSLAGMLATFRNLLGLSIQLGSVEPVFAGDEALCQLLLDNPGQSRYALHWQAPELLPSPPLQLPERSVQTITLRLPAWQRGLLRLPRLRLESRYPLGLFVAWSILRLPWQQIVYPRPLDWPLPPPLGNATEHGPQAPRGDEDFNGLRDRQPADPWHHVAWKSVTRWPQGDPQERPLPVKQFTGGPQGETYHFHWDALPAACDHETRLSILTGWIVRAAAAGWAYGLTLPDQSFPLASGAEHRHRCLTALALQPQPHAPHP